MSNQGRNLCGWQKRVTARPLPKSLLRQQLWIAVRNIITECPSLSKDHARCSNQGANMSPLLGQATVVHIWGSYSGHRRGKWNHLISFFFDLLFSRNLMKSLKTLAVTLGWVSQPQVADLVCLLGNLILLSSMAVDLGSGAGFSPEKRGRITHYTTNWRWCLSLSLEPKLNWTAEPQGVRQSCQNSADRSGFCKPPEGWHADKLEWHRLPSTIASLASLFYLVSLLAIL